MDSEKLRCCGQMALKHVSAFYLLCERGRSGPTQDFTFYVEHQSGCGD